MVFGTTRVGWWTPLVMIGETYIWCFHGFSIRCSYIIPDKQFYDRAIDLKVGGSQSNLVLPLMLPSSIEIETGMIFRIQWSSWLLLQDRHNEI